MLCFVFHLFATDAHAQTAIPSVARGCFPRRPTQSERTNWIPTKRKTVTSELDDGRPGTLRAILNAASPGTLVDIDPRIRIIKLRSPIRLEKKRQLTIAPRNSTTIHSSLQFKSCTDIYVGNLRIYSLNQIVGNYARDALKILDSERFTVEHCTMCFGQDQTMSWVGSKRVLIRNNIAAFCARGVGPLTYNTKECFFIGNLVSNHHYRPVFGNAKGLPAEVRVQGNYFYNQSIFTRFGPAFVGDVIDNVYQAGPTRKPYRMASTKNGDPAGLHYGRNRAFDISGRAIPMDWKSKNSRLNVSASDACVQEALSFVARPGTESHDGMEAALWSDFKNRRVSTFTKTECGAGNFCVVPASTIYRSDGTTAAPNSPYVIFDKQISARKGLIPFRIAQVFSKSGSNELPSGTTVDLWVSGKNGEKHAIRRGMNLTDLASGVPGREAAILVSYDFSNRGKITIDTTRSAFAPISAKFCKLHVVIRSSDRTSTTREQTALFQSVIDG